MQGGQHPGPVLARAAVEDGGQGARCSQDLDGRVSTAVPPSTTISAYRAATKEASRPRRQLLGRRAGHR